MICCNYKKHFIPLVIVVLLCLGFAAAGCSQEEESKDKNDEVSPDRRDIELLYVNWECAVASTHVVGAILEDMGYDVEYRAVTQGGIEKLWSDLAEGQGDAMTTAWLPSTQEEYFEKYEEQVDKVAINFEPALTGLVVPAYVEIESITEINNHIERFQGQIIGIKPKAGVMKHAENAIEAYNLDIELTESSDAIMARTLNNAVTRLEWIVVTGWKPHWKFAEYDLKYLDDPQGVFPDEEDAEYIATVTRQGLKDDKPDAYFLLENFKWSADDINEVMLLNQQDMVDPRDAARQWVDENQDKVEQWRP